MSDNLLKIGIDSRTGSKVPKRQAPQLVVVIPVVEKLVDVLAACLILLSLRVVQVECGNLSDEEGLYVGMVPLPGDAVGLIGQVKLAG